MTRDDLPHAANLRWGRFSQPGAYYHITKCRHQDAALSLADARVAPILIDSIRWHQGHGHAHLLAFVVMPDHVHWLLVLGEERTLDDVMEGFCGYTWQQIVPPLVPQARTIWEEEYHDRQLRPHERTWETVAYIHDNPVREDFCARQEDSPWSTANARYSDWIEEEYLA